ncbi:hypothetical protein HID58_009400 [Brassica napus]|uniref:Uncharacterized protein n=1 Tax=Brassica napus TaxID=3708 RepID=A0ABQ8DSQ1_BRANA|nr:hypothetical protein HID58_009400 [Brassica napus]
MLHHHTRQIHHGERGMLTDSVRLLLVLTTVTFTEILPSTKAIVSFKVPDNSSGKQSPYRSFEAEPIDRCNSHSRYTSHLVLTLDMTHPPKLSPSTMLETLQSTLNHYSPLLTQSIIECIYHYFISLNPGDYLNYKKEPKQNNLRQNTLALYCLHEITMTKKEIKNCSETNECNVIAQIIASNTGSYESPEAAET